MLGLEMGRVRETGRTAHIDVSEAVKKLLLAAAYTTGFDAEVTVCVTKDKRCQFFSYPPSSELDDTIKNVCMLKSSGPVENICDVFIDLDLPVIDEVLPDVKCKVEPDDEDLPTDLPVIDEVLPDVKCKVEPDDEDLPTDVEIDMRSGGDYSNTGSCPSPHAGQDKTILDVQSQPLDQTLLSNDKRYGEASEPSQLNTISKQILPWKGTLDLGTGKASNHGSTFSGSEHSPKPSMESLPPVTKTPQLRWLAQVTEQQLAIAVIGPDRDECRFCGQRGTTKRIKVHVRQHFVKYFCPCGHCRTSRDSVGDHQRTHQRQPAHGGLEGTIYEVDAISYGQFTAAMGWKDPPPFGDCRPTLGPLSNTQRPPKNMSNPKKKLKGASTDLVPVTDIQAKMLLNCLTTADVPLTTSTASCRVTATNTASCGVTTSNTTNCVVTTSETRDDGQNQTLKTIAMLRTQASCLEATLISLRSEADRLEATLLTLRSEADHLEVALRRFPTYK